MSTQRFASFEHAAWTPRPEAQQTSCLWDIMRRLGVRDIESLHALAIQDPSTYYNALIDYFGLKFSQRPSSLVDVARGVAFPRWFPGGRLNLVDSCLPPREGVSERDPAVVVADERGRSTKLSRADLRADVQSLANYLVEIGVEPGDRIGLFMPLSVEATVAFFACAWVGAVAVPAFSGYGPEALATRLQDAEAKALITSSGFYRRDAWIDMRNVAATASAAVDGLAHVVCVGGEPDADLDRTIWRSWDQALEAGKLRGDTAPVAMDPDAPLLLIYTSGTTGRPKGIVHSHAGFLLKVVSDFALAFDVRRGDRFCWITDLGWIVGPQMMVANAALGASAVYYLGALDTPDWEQIWRVCEQQRVNLLGVSPTAVRGMAAASPEGPRGAHDLSSLRTFVSTGEAWDPASWRWLFDRVGRGKRPIVNYTGGTEIGGGILASYAALPLTDCAFAGPIVGMDADVVTVDGRDGAESVGELVVRNIWPGMTHSFWGGADELYLETYWSEIPGVWRHGDLAQRDAQGWWYLRGRSDDTLKIAGRRVGPAEIESALLQSSSVVEAAVVGVPDEMKGQAIVAFVVLGDGASTSETSLQGEVRAKLGSSLVPSRVHFVKALPKTRNGKVVRRAIVARYLGRPAGDLSTLESADALLGIPQAAA